MAINSRSLPLGHEIRGFRIEKVLGEGGFGITYLAHDVKLNRKVAIKEYYPRDWAVRDSKLRIRAVGNEEAVGTFKWGLEAFLQEAQLLARFAHPNIVAVSQLFETNGTAYLVMDYCDGQSLDEIIKRNGPLRQDQLEGIWYPLLNGLEQVHATGFLHRDIKPANLYVRADGSPVLLDFGSARKSTTENNQVVTTLVADGYSPIEQYAGNRPQGPYTDIYGLGATLYRAVTNIRPLSSTNRDYKDTLEPAAINAKGRYASDLLAAIDAAMAVLPEKRPQDIAQWRAMIKKSAPAPTKVNKPSQDPTGRVEPPVKPEPSQKPAKAGVKLVVSLALVVMVVVAVFWAGGNNQPATDTAALPPVVGKPEPSGKLMSVEIQDCAECPTMRLVPAGTFTMGSPDFEAGRAQNEGPQRTVSVDAFYVSKFEITVKQWRACVSADKCEMPTGYAQTNDDMPMTHMTWFQAQAYVEWLSTHKKVCQLLTEAEWEYAARAGSESEYFFGADKLNLGIYAWHQGNSNQEVHAVGQKKPNNFGLFDMYGNVAEWTADIWNPTFQNAPKNADAWNSGDPMIRVVRGGAWMTQAENLRSAARMFGGVLVGDETIGFRVACKLD